MYYVDAFVMPVKRSREAEYQDWARLGAKVWLEHGALTYVETRADDVQPGQITSYPKAVQLEDNEIVYVSWATYRDRAHRDEVMAKVMADPRVQMSMEDSPANMQRMIFGGFTAVVSAP